MKKNKKKKKVIRQTAVGESSTDTDASARPQKLPASIVRARQRALIGFRKALLKDLKETNGKMTPEQAVQTLDKVAAPVTRRKRPASKDAVFSQNKTVLKNFERLFHPPPPKKQQQLPSIRKENDIAAATGEEASTVTVAQHLQGGQGVKRLRSAFKKMLEF